MQRRTPTERRAGAECLDDATLDFRAETIVSDLRYKLHREHNRRLLGAKAVDEYVRPGPLVLRSGRLAYDGRIPFASPKYLAQKDPPPWELQAQAGSPSA